MSWVYFVLLCRWNLLFIYVIPKENIEMVVSYWTWALLKIGTLFLLFTALLQNDSYFQNLHINWDWMGYVMSVEYFVRQEVWNLDMWSRKQRTRFGLVLMISTREFVVGGNGILSTYILLIQFQTHKINGSVNSTFKVIRFTHCSIKLFSRFVVLLPNKK